MASSAVGCGSWTTHQVKGFSSSRNKNLRKEKLGKCVDNNKNKKKGLRVSCVSSSAVVSSDPYKTLRIHPSATEPEVKKAFRQLALQYHPDVCRGSNCLVQFHQINEAYDIVLNHLRGGEVIVKEETYDHDDEAVMNGCDDQQDWDDLWEEWMGWEGAGIRDYSSHINPYI